MRNVSQNHTVADFSLTNQNGINITNKDYENKIYVVDFFFTRSLRRYMAINSNFMYWCRPGKSFYSFF